MSSLSVIAGVFIICMAFLGAIIGVLLGLGRKR